MHACVCVHVYVFCPTLCFLGDKSSHCVQCVCMPSQSCICMYLHRNWGKPPRVSLSIPNTFPFKWLSNAVVYNFNQSVNSLTGFTQWFLKWQSLVHQTDCFPPSGSMLLFFFCHLPSIPKPAVIPTVRGCCLTVPDLWNDDRGARAPYPSVFIFPPPSHRFHHHRLLYARLSSGFGHSDGDGCSWSDRAGDPPKVISALASTCWPGPLARPLQVRGQRVMEGSVTRRRKGRRGRERRVLEWEEKVY